MVRDCIDHLPPSRTSHVTSRIPPIQCLLTFEALARLRSVTHTAEELFVTPSAVSHGVKQLDILSTNRPVLPYSRSMLTPTLPDAP